MQAACPGEVVNYTCTVTQAITLGWTAAPVLVNPSLLRFTTSDPAGRLVGCSDIAAIQCADLDFQATLTSVVTVSMTAADMTSTFRFTARPGLNGTVVECSGFTIPSTPSESHTLIVAGEWFICCKYRKVYYTWYYIFCCRPVSVIVHAQGHYLRYRLCDITKVTMHLCYYAALYQTTDLQIWHNKDQYHVVMYWKLGLSWRTVPYNTSSLHHVMLLSLRSLHCVILYCNVGWWVKNIEVHHSCQQCLIAELLGLSITVRVRIMVRARARR